MKLTIRNAHEEWREPVEKETQRQAAKLEKLLKRYAPDLVLLHADIEKHARKESYTFTVNLSLPTGTLHATGEGSDVLASVKAAFAEICAQCKKHQALLRKDYEWKRKRPPTLGSRPRFPVEKVCQVLRLSSGDELGPSEIDQNRQPEGWGYKLLTNLKI